MPRYMLDTDICSFILKRSHQPVLRRLQRVATKDVCISVVTLAELLFGVELSPRQEQDSAAVESFLRHLAVLDFPDEAATHYAKIRAVLQRRGALIGANDLFIAAHARSMDAILVTNNPREFGRIEGLLIENWALSD